MPSRQGHQVDALHDFRHHVRRKFLVADEAFDDGGGVTFPKSIERQARYTRPANPRRTELGTESDDEQPGRRG